MRYVHTYNHQVQNVHYVNAFLCGVSWLSTIAMIMLPRWGWFNPDMGSGIFGEFNAMRGLFWTCGTVTDMNFVCYYISPSMFLIPGEMLIMQSLTCSGIWFYFIFDKLSGRRHCLRKVIITRFEGLMMQTAVCLLCMAGMEWSRAYEHHPARKINIMRVRLNWHRYASSS